jgi:hypothetical protein
MMAAVTINKHNNSLTVHINLPSMMALVTINKHIIIPWLSTLNLPSMMADVTINNHIIIP